MCAINGFSFEDEAKAAAMGKATVHRGPDAEGLFVGEVTLQHNRLSIIDCDSRSNQPLKSPDGRYILIYNGELYNFRELKKELTYDFQTESDTEVVLASFLKWGKDCVSHFNGMYAFALWDNKEQELFMARDPRGIKPLYYFYDGRRFIFSSEMRGILAHDIERQLDHEALEHFFRLLYVPEPFTLIKGVRKFPHGHTGVWKDGSFSTTAFSVKDMVPEIAGSQAGRAEQLKELMSGAVSRQLIADVPVGIYLSGGVDSTMVLERAVSSGVKPQTFSTLFDLAGISDDSKFNQDAVLAEQTAKFYGVPYTPVPLSIQDIFDATIPAIEALEEPNANPTFIPMYLLAKRAKEDVSVVLTGTGGDELFGGYPRYQLSRRLSHMEGVLPLLEKIMPSKAVPAGIDRYARFMFQPDDALIGVPRGGGVRELFKEKLSSHESFEEAFMRLDQNTWLIDDALLQQDKTSMAHSLEARVPILDEVVVQFAHKLPIEDKVSLFDTKILPKKAFADVFPPGIINQPKRGWFTPSAKWLRDEQFSAFAREVLSKEYYGETADLFDFDAVGEVLEDHISMRGYHRTLLWSLITFQVWARKHSIRV